MILGKLAIERAFQSGDWKAFDDNTPIQWDKLRIGANSIDVTLSNTIMRPLKKHGHIVELDEAQKLFYRETICDSGDGQLILLTGDFVLGAVNERFDCSAPLFLPQNLTYQKLMINTTSVRRCYFAPMIEGRSTVGRLGISVHTSAGFGDYGFSGAFTLEIHNCGPFTVKLVPGMRIAQVYFMEVLEPGVYDGAYKSGHNSGPVAPVLGEGRF